MHEVSCEVAERYVYEGLCEGGASVPYLWPRLYLSFFQDSMWAMREVGEKHLTCGWREGVGRREKGESEREGDRERNA